MYKTFFQGGGGQTSSGNQGGEQNGQTRNRFGGFTAVYPTKMKGGGGGGAGGKQVD